MTHLIIGLGEVGQALQRIFICDGVDLKSVYKTEEKYDIIHITFPYSNNFEEQVKTYQEKYQPKYTIIHSTVPVGTSRKLNAIHSPIRGLHPDLQDGILTFHKFLAGKDASQVADEFRRRRMRVILFDNQEASELGKLLDTEYYRVCINFAKEAKRLSDENKVPFHEVYTLFNDTYNEGYSLLGHKEFVRPTLQPIMKEIGGHCVEPNHKLLYE